MAKNIDWQGIIFPDVPWVRLKKEGGGLAQYDDTTDADAIADDITLGKTAYVNNEKVVGTNQGGGAPVINPLSVTENGIYSAPGGVDGYSPVTVNVSGGGGGASGFDLLETLALGHISTTSTTASNTGKTVFVSSDKINKSLTEGYDLLIVETSRDSMPEGDGHIATVGLIFLYNASNLTSRSSYTVVNSAWNCKKNGRTYNARAVASYGLYPNSCTWNGGLNIPIYQRYNGTNTGTIDGDYTTRVYGARLFDLIGG